MPFPAGNLILILCFAIGICLLGIEAVMPGFGVAGISGIILEIVAIVCAWTQYGTLFAVCLTALSLLLIALTVFLSYRSIMKGRLSKTPLILKDTEDVSAAPNPLEACIGREGVTVTALRPIGIAEIDGTRVNASGCGEFIGKGVRVRVTGLEGDHVNVKQIQ